MTARSDPEGASEPLETTPRVLRWAGRIWRVISATTATCIRYRVTGLAAEAAFFGVLSLPPLIFGLAGAIGFVTSTLDIRTITGPQHQPGNFPPSLPDRLVLLLQNEDPMTTDIAAETTRPSRAAASPRAKPANPRRKKGEGQWALGYREPLNPNEQSKKDDNPLNVRARIENIYAKGGFASIDPGDLRGRFRWYGLYTQRRPGIDGGKTATLEPWELDDEYFMLRIRIDGGALTTEQLRVIGQISVEFARDTADVTDRQNVQLHWIRIEDVPEIWRRLEAVGLQTTEACGDCPRVILGSPVAGIADEEIIDPTPAIRDIVDRYIGDPEYANLPRKFKTALTGHPVHDVAPEVNDVAFVGVVHPDYGPGFDLWVGGGLSTNPMLAVRLGAWVPREEVAEVWAGVVAVFRDYGYRRLRTRARIKFLVADWGAEKFRDVLEAEYLKRPPGAGRAYRAGRSCRSPPSEGWQVLCRAFASGRAGERQQLVAAG